MKNQEVLILALVAAITPLFVLFIKAIYKSKCTDVSCCWGILSFKRNVEIETACLEDNEMKKTGLDKKGSVIGKQTLEPKGDNTV